MHHPKTFTRFLIPEDLIEGKYQKDTKEYQGLNSKKYSIPYSSTDISVFTAESILIITSKITIKYHPLI